MKEFFRTKGSVLFILVIILTGLVSFRFLSDPDIGTHLRTGKWIIENHRIPDKDTFTYTCTDHDYIDSYWLFQVLVYSVYRISGYSGLSIFVFLLSMLLFYLVMLRLQRAGVPLFIASCVLVIGFLCIESRITLRPEMFTFLFMTGMLLVLDRYYQEKRKNLYFLPLIMLFWCNMHGLFILGFLLIGAYFISLYLRDRKVDPYFLLWIGLSVLICFVNPYSYKLLAYPFLLNTRLSNDNIFHQHIRELTSFIRLDHFIFNDYLFILLFSMAFIFILLTWKNRKIHEFILLIVFFYLAWVSIRNIGLFSVVSIPVLCISARDFRKWRQPWIANKIGNARMRIISTILFVLSVIFIIGTGMRIFTNSYYLANNSYNKTGIGVDDRHLPVKAVAFLNTNHLNGRIINSLSLGGWLSWGLPQPVFIDGRLEVVGESLYNEVRNSWSGGLGNLIRKYEPSLIIYNYGQYYPWTIQLSRMPGWRLIYLDGFTAIFAKNDYAEEIPVLDFSRITQQFNIGTYTDEQEKAILNLEPLSGFSGWVQGFYKRPDYPVSDLSNMASFCLQMNNKQTALKLFVELLRRTNGGSRYVYYVLADIYRSQNEKEKAAICYKRILSFDPGNRIARLALESITSEQVTSKSTRVEDHRENDAILSFNEGNMKYQQGDINGAIASYKKAIELNPSYFKAYNNLGILKATVMKNYKDALEDFTKAIEIKPDYDDAYLGRGTCWFKLNETEKACHDWKKALSLGNRQVGKMIRLYCK
jgi:tetratricopeptide (TPR) repeat protein